MTDLSKLYTQEELKNIGRLIANGNYEGIPGSEMKAWDELARKEGNFGPDYYYGADRSIDARGHSGDIGKLPNHVTYSKDSMFYTPGDSLAGRWANINENGSGTYIAPKQLSRDRLNQLRWLIKNGYNDGDKYLTYDGKEIK